MTERLGNYEESRRQVSVDTVLFTAEGSAEPKLQVLLLRRELEPLAGRWEIPSGPVQRGEGLAGAAAHRLEGVVGIRGVFLHQVVALGAPVPPRTSGPGIPVPLRPGIESADTLSILHLGLVRRGEHRKPVASDARQVAWFDVDGKLPPLVHDHGKLIDEARHHLRDRLGESPALFELLPEEFTLGDVQSLCESILGRPLDKRNFRRKLLELGFVLQTKKFRRDGPHRPARLFRFDARRFDAWVKRARALPFR